jgi:hypothetical protein
MSARLVPLVLLAAVAAVPRPAADPPPAFTAFPEVIPQAPGKEVNPDVLYPLVVGASPRAIPKDGPALTQLRVARLNELVSFIGTEQRVRDRYGPHRSNPPAWAAFLARLRAAWLAAGRAGAELEDTAAGRAAWFEEVVLALKGIEQEVEVLVVHRDIRRGHRHAARADRLTAELELLAARRRAAAEPKPPPRPKPPAPVRTGPGPVRFTAFPELKPEPPWWGLPPRVVAAYRLARACPRLFGPDPFPERAGDRPREKLLKAQFAAGRAFAHRFSEKVRLGTYTADEFVPFTEFVPRLTRTAAALDTAGGAREWAGERVRFFWWAEETAGGARAAAGTLPPPDLPLLRAERLAAEVELLALRERDLPARRTAADPTGGFTAFPELKPAPPRPVTGGPVPPRPVTGGPAADEPDPVIPTEQVVRVLRSNEAWAAFAADDEYRTPLDILTGKEIPGHAALLARAVRYRAGVESDAAGRRRWFALGVMKMKELEAYTDRRVETGTDPTYMLDRVRYDRLAAELELFDFLETNPAAR